MVKEYTIAVEGNIETVVVSDEKEALLAAKAAGRAVIALWEKEEKSDLFAASYAVPALEYITEELLEDVVRRRLGLPWRIAETKRLLIREFTLKDGQEVPEEEDMSESDRVFHEPELLKAYIKNQYGFYEYGIWALVQKETGVLIGKAGFSPLSLPSGDALELGYHIFKPYRNRGYATEACRAILREAAGWQSGMTVYARIQKDNPASVRTIEGLGFRLVQEGQAAITGSECIPDKRQPFLFAWNC